MKKIAGSLLIVTAVLAIGGFFLWQRAQRKAAMAAETQRLEKEEAVAIEIRRRESVRAAVSRCETWVGMTRGELWESWGLPDAENETASAVGTQYQLIYNHEDSDAKVKKCGRDSLPRRAMVYMESDHVTAIQNSK